ncbi:autotransporter outer membrane beta-barrel domain-containing protein [Sphingosinicella terrae]|uniref:autotransporter outer membrane beta-barrel domain-containing protein n=1 Tax=Sphingosinicella terrae TaxID=2172047 RepID=UPI000E0D25A1|nr:autotransporter domain-containing protein [Sphingosinicella terrae]
MRQLLAATCLTPAVLGLAAPLHAETVINDARTAPLRTSTVANGGADDIRIGTNGSVKPTSGTAITIDSNDNVINQGTIQITGANNSTGILANPGRAGTITNSGKIILDEDYTPADGDKDGDNDGPFAQGSGRNGILVGAGGTFTGPISNSGTITIEGNQSAGIRLGSRLAGSLSNGGTIDVLGNDSYGVRAGAVDGNVTLNGTVQARGANSVGAALDGNIGGRLTVQGNINATGYRSTTAPADPSKLDADDLLQGGPALRIAGNVAGGILFDVAPPNNSTTDDDEDDDGIKDSEEGNAVIRSYGAAPAVQIGSATQDVAIGAVAGQASGHGIVIKGIIGGSGVYSGVAGNGLVIGGLGRNVTIAGGITVAGTVAANANNAGATALRLGSGTSVPNLVNSGAISASGGGGTAATSTRALVIESGASLSTIRNSGSITASAGGANGSAGAIIDLAGTVGLVENSGTIGAVAGAGPDSAIAIDLRANNGGAIVRQTAAAQNAPASEIVGNVLFGSGDDLFEVGSGTVEGTTRFGAGADRLSLSGNAAYIGQVDFGAGANTLALAGTSRLTGTLANSGSLAVTVNGGALDLTNTGTVSLNSLAVSGGGSIRVNINPAGGNGTLYQVAGEASFATGSKLVVNITNTAASVGNYVVVRAGTLTGGSNLSLGEAVLPFLYAGSVSANQNSGEVSLSIRRKNATELGLNRSETSAFDAVYAALGEDDDIEGVFLGVADGNQFRATLRQMLPDHAGGAFETVTQGSRATTRFLADPRAPVLDMGGWGFFLQQVAWGSSTDLTDTAAYEVSGWGASGGAEIRAGNMGAFGVALSYLLGDDVDRSTDNEVSTEQFELTGYWRGSWGNLSAFARASAARVGFDSLRTFIGTVDGETVTREARGDWNGTLLSAGAGLSYEVRTGRLSIRPAATLEYYTLDESGYTETGGGDGFNLVVGGRDSDELAASGTLTLGYDLASLDPEETFFRVEIEGGRRQIVGGSLGSTTARFADGEEFTLVPDERESGWTGRLRLLGGSRHLRVGGEVGAEEQFGEAAISARLTLHSTF